MILADEGATRQLGALLARVLRAGDVVALSGPLGVGKTALTRAILHAAGHHGDGTGGQGGLVGGGIDPARQAGGHEKARRAQGACEAPARSKPSCRDFAAAAGEEAARIVLSAHAARSTTDAVRSPISKVGFGIPATREELSSRST